MEMNAEFQFWGTATATATAHRGEGTLWVWGEVEGLILYVFPFFVSLNVFFLLLINSSSIFGNVKRERLVGSKVLPKVEPPPW